MKRLKEMTSLIVGLGQIGGSLAIDLRKERVVRNVIGYDADTRVSRAAKRMGVVNSIANSLTEGITSADIVIIAVPIRAAIKKLPDILRTLRADQICFDVASTKRKILKVAEQSGCRNFVGGHPIAGTEKQGLSGAIAGLFRDRTFVITSSRDTSRQALVRVKQLVKAIGARPLAVIAEAHDRIVAHTSHLPYVLAVTLVHTAVAATGRDQTLPRLVGGSLRSATRVAKSSPELTVDMLLTNSREVRKGIAKLMSEMRMLDRMLKDADERKLRRYVEAAHRWANRHGDSREQGGRP